MFTATDDSDALKEHMKILLSVVYIPVRMLLFMKCLYSFPDLMEYRFGRKTRFLVAGLIAFAMMATVASQIAAFATVLKIIGGISFEAGAWIALIIIVAYTFVSGLYGVVYTDVIQFVVIIFFLYLLLPVKCVSTAGGISSILSSVPPKMLEFNVTPDIVGWLFTSLIFTFASAEMWQRSFSVKSPKDSKRGMFMGNNIYALTIVIILVLSLSA